MKRTVALALVMASLFVGLIAPQAEARVTAGQVATYTIRHYPGNICGIIRQGVNIGGYRWALREFKSGYGSGKTPSAAAVFSVLVRRCFA